MFYENFFTTILGQSSNKFKSSLLLQAETAGIPLVAIPIFMKISMTSVIEPVRQNLLLRLIITINVDA